MIINVEKSVIKTPKKTQMTIQIYLIITKNETIHLKNITAMQKHIQISQSMVNNTLENKNKNKNPNDQTGVGVVLAPEGEGDRGSTLLS